MPARPIAAALVVLSIAAPAAAEEPREPWPWTFPLLGAGAAAQGADLPLPAGLSVNFNSQRDTVVLSGVRAGLTGQPMVPLDFVEWGIIRNHSRTVTARADLWLLPMVDVYAVGGPIWSTTDVAIGQPFPSQGPVDSKGWTAGAGLTGAIGSSWGFVSADVNYAFTWLDILDRPQHTLMVSARMGRRFMLTPDVGLSGWVGGSYLSMRSRSVGHLRLGKAIAGADSLQLTNFNCPAPPSAQYDHCFALVSQLAQHVAAGNSVGSAEIHYDLQVQPREAWTMLAGAQVEVGKHWFALLEASFLGSRVAVTLSAGGRLGI